MKSLKRVFVGLVLIMLLAVVGLFITGNDHLLTALPKTYLIGKTGPDIDDYGFFDNETVKTSEVQEWALADSYNKATVSEKTLDVLESTESVSFLVIKNSEIVFEKYWEGYDQKTPANSFSMAKSIVGMAVGIAIDEGKIKSIDDKASDYIPELKVDDRKNVTIKELLQMTSGISFDESYANPFGYMSKMYYGDDLLEKTFEYKLEDTPGDKWRYAGGNTILLALLVENSTGRSLHEYVSDKLWKPMGASGDAMWSTDRDGETEKCYCCYYSNARDFSRFGELFLHGGNWKGKQLISEDYVKATITPVILNDGSEIRHYGMQWWLGEHKGLDFWIMRGYLGQYVIVIPEKNLIVTRMGHHKSKNKTGVFPSEIFDFIDEGLRMTE